MQTLQEIVPGLRKKVIIDGAGHWIQQEKPQEVNAAVLEFHGRGFDRPSREWRTKDRLASALVADAGALEGRHAFPAGERRLDDPDRQGGARNFAEPHAEIEQRLCRADALSPCAPSAETWPAMQWSVVGSIACRDRGCRADDIAVEHHRVRSMRAARIAPAIAAISRRRRAA